MILEDKAIVITGSGRGIGAACAMGAARQGATVVINDIDEAVVADTVSAIISDGGRAVGCVADVSNWDEAGRLVNTCVEKLGRIDGLVNNAALYHRARIDEFDPETARSLVDVNVMGPLFCTAHAIKGMVEQGSGSIINVISGAHMGMPTMGVYGATKGAVASMIYTWALEMLGTGVRVNGLSPFGATRMATPSEEEMKDPAVLRMLAEMQPAETNSPVLEYLLSDRSASVNGQLVRLDKGELQLYTHPALLLPAIKRDEWTAEAVAEVFDNELRDRLVSCGVLGMRELPVEMEGGFWKRSGVSLGKTSTDG